MKTAFITGISGFAGGFLAKALLKKKSYNVVGTYNSGKGLASLDALKDQIHLVQIDLTKKSVLEQALTETKPDFIFHLAALASPAQSFKDPSLTFTTNIIGQINLLEAVRVLSLPARILIVSSAEVYGLVTKENLPEDEETPLRPVSPYAVSKITQEYLGVQYHLSYNMDIIRVRPFNHIGPGQTPSYAVSAFAKQIAEIEKGKQEPVVQVGNLTAKRDFTDVRDIVEAYIGILEQGTFGEVYNVGSGVSHRMDDVLHKLIGLSKTKITVEEDTARFMPVDIPENRCDTTKLRKAINWETTIPFEKSLSDVLDYWREMA